MLPFQPETLESMRARLPAVLNCVYDTQAIERGEGLRPGAQRRHVFDFDNGLRCIASLDRQPNGHVYLHMSFSLQEWDGNLPLFFNRVEQVAVDFWPDTILLVVQQFMTPNAVHVIYEPPADWKRFYHACDAPRKKRRSEHGMQ